MNWGVIAWFGAIVLIVVGTLIFFRRDLLKVQQKMREDEEKMRRKLGNS